MKTTSRVASVVAGLALAFGGAIGLAGAASAAYAPVPTGPTAWTPDGPVHAIVESGGTLYVGGLFTGNLVALDASSGALEWNANLNGDVRAIAVDGSRVFAGGAFTTSTAAGVTQTHRKLINVDASTGVADAKWKATAGGTVRDMVVYNGNLYFGGIFSTANGVTQKGLGSATEADPGKAVPGFTATTDNAVFGMALSGSRLVFSGNYTSVDGAPRASLASLTLTPGNVPSYTLDGWSPARICTGCNQYWDVAIYNNAAYVGSSGNHYGAVDLSPLAPRKFSVATNGDVQSLAISPDGILYIGGHFGTIGGVTYHLLAAVNPANGAVYSNFTVRFVGLYPGIWALDATASNLYAGGHFTAAGPRPNKYPYLAFFPVV
jgi:outer membrane protein assembly factor BamB